MFHGRGKTANRLLTVTEATLREIGIKEEEYYEMKKLAIDLGIARSSVSRMLKHVKHTTESERCHSPKLSGVRETFLFLGKDLLEFFRSRDEYFGVGVTSTIPKSPIIPRAGKWA